MITPCWLVPVIVPLLVITSVALRPTIPQFPPVIVPALSMIRRPPCWESTAENWPWIMPPARLFRVTEPVLKVRMLPIKPALLIRPSLVVLCRTPPAAPVIWPPARLVRFSDPPSTLTPRPAPVSEPPVRAPLLVMVIAPVE